MLTNALSAKAVASLKDGKHRDGQGLQFEVKGGSRRWTFSYMFEGRQRELAIGKYPAMSLADARAKRAELREAKDRGLDPKSVLAGAAVPDRAVTFRQDILTFLAHMRGQWTPGHLKEWQQSVDRLAGALMDKATVSLTQADVVSVIKPAWDTTNETARRVLGRIEQTIEHAMAVDPGRFSGPNPCANVLRLLPRVAVNVKPRQAMPWRDLPAFFAELRQREGPAARALEFLLLTCCPRTGEVIPATWGEIDGDRWHVPAIAYEVRPGPDNPANLGRNRFAGGHQAGWRGTRHAHIRESPARRFGPPDRRRDAGASAREDGPWIHRAWLPFLVHGLGRGGSSRPAYGRRTCAGPQDRQPGSEGLSED